MPQAREAKRKAFELPLPGKGEDAAERKRVLNVLAQRRYRQRRREHLKTLEAQAEQRKPSEGSQPEAEESIPEEMTVDEQIPTFNTFGPATMLQPADFQGQQFDDPFSMFDSHFGNPTPDWNMQLPSISNSPISSPGPSLTSLSTPDSTMYSFPDEAHLGIVELNLLRGAMTIAKRLNVDDMIWSLDSVSPFTARSMVFADFQHLPMNLRPTAIQKSQPHHPVIDLLPWPGVRDKLILVFSQPPEIRPKIASSATAMVEFVYDLEDSAEGCRIWGDDPCSDQSWEVGEKVFKNWWWAFDGDVIRRSNVLRQQRGARLLGMQGSVLGEVA